MKTGGGGVPGGAGADERAAGEGGRKEDRDGRPDDLHIPMQSYQPRTSFLELFYS